MNLPEIAPELNLLHPGKLAPTSKQRRLIVRILFPALFVIFTFGCQDPQTVETEDQISEESRKEVLREIEALYSVYSTSDLSWVDYYNDEYTVAANDGQTYSRSADTLRAEWVDLYKKYDVILNDRGEPVLEASSDQVFHYNSFDESLINKQTGDTIRNIGTWVVLWKKQENKEWKIIFETYHAQPMEEW